MESDFREFGKILHIGKLYMSITQKIHGSNAQIYIYKDDDELKGKAKYDIVDVKELESISFLKAVEGAMND